MSDPCGYAKVPKLSLISLLQSVCRSPRVGELEGSPREGLQEGISNQPPIMFMSPREGLQESQLLGYLGLRRICYVLGSPRESLQEGVSNQPAIRIPWLASHLLHVGLPEWGSTDLDDRP